jgi:hypothetical protein
VSKSVQIVNYSEGDITDKIYIIRGQRVMLDRDLAEMYDVPTSQLNQAVRRNISSFPEDFMFQLTEQELKSLISKKEGRGGVRKLPFAFTEQGVAMPACPVGRLSSVLRSERAIQVNIQIIRVYTRMKQILFDNKDLWLKMEKIEQSLIKKDEEVKAIFKILQKLLVQKEKPRNEIGFLAGRNKQNK